MIPLYGLDFISNEVFRIVPDFPRLLFNVIIIIMPVTGYIDQLRCMIATKSICSFKMQTCLILLFSNLLKFLYWSVEPHETYLLGQSIAVFVVQVCLGILYFVYKDTNRSKFGKFPSPSIQNLNLRILHAPNAFDFFNALLFYFFCVILSFFVSSLFNAHYTATIAVTLSNLLDTAVSLPQFISIVIRRDFASSSSVLILQYIIGDVFKLMMFLVGGSAWPFVFGAALQTSIDSTTAAFYLVLARPKALRQGKEEA